MRSCLSPARVSLRFSFHLADGLVLVRWWFLVCLVCLFLVCLVCLFLLLVLFLFAGCLVDDRILPISRNSIRTHSLPCSFVGSLSLPRASSSLTNFQPIQCGFRLTRFTCFTCSKGILLGCGAFVVAFFWFACLVFGFGLFSVSCFCFPLLLCMP